MHKALLSLWDSYVSHPQSLNKSYYPFSPQGVTALPSSIGNRIRKASVKTWQAAVTQHNQLGVVQKWMGDTLALPNKDVIKLPLRIEGEICCQGKVGVMWHFAWPRERRQKKLNLIQIWHNYGGRKGMVGGVLLTHPPITSFLHTLLTPLPPHPSIMFDTVSDFPNNPKNTHNIWVCL